ncbi:twin-arginine translocase TatA/TatE family subunit [Flavobacterium magnum]|uniref:Sec-independent protein translocase protein TatA n=1 Tax=Flavobacterium magnum TaxID=2162713 RepID=A0A2S0RDA5_9FLAO|nr:twin-arginine translocase TatA/TatE family subunit [Flavobacterium magnum]AWA29270.1 twin-arginine translocase TatA/TatE family subunit [Flavobacterium magnum]
MNTLYFFLGEITPMKVILVLAIVLLLFGGKKIPELMRGLGSGVKEFKNASKGEEEAPAVRREDEKI